MNPRVVGLVLAAIGGHVLTIILIFVFSAADSATPRGPVVTPFPTPMPNVSIGGPVLTQAVVATVPPTGN